MPGRETEGTLAPGRRVVPLAGMPNPPPLPAPEPSPAVPTPSTGEGASPAVAPADPAGTVVRSTASGAWAVPVEAPLPGDVRLGGIAAFLAGLKAPWVGLRFMNARPKLWRHGILPVLCNLVLTAALVVGLYYASSWGFAWVDEKLAGGWGWKILAVLSKTAVVCVALAAAVGAWILFQGILCGFFYSRLAREVEIALGLDPRAMREVPFLYQVIDAVRDLAWLTTIAAGCLVLNFVPVIGSVAAFFVGAYFNCLAFGIEYLDYPQALRARDRRAQRAFARQHRAATLGLGAGAFLISFLPLLGAVLLTTATTGAVLLYRRLEPNAAAGVPPAR